MAAVVLRHQHRWECPSCDAELVTHDARPHTPVHACRGMRGLTVPFVPLGSSAEHVVVQRGDYARSDTLATDGAGRPLMAVVTRRDDGEDCTIYAPCGNVRLTDD